MCKEQDMSQVTEAKILTPELNYHGSHTLPLGSAYFERAPTLSLIDLQRESKSHDNSHGQITGTADYGQIPNPSFYPIQSSNFCNHV